MQLVTHFNKFLTDTVNLPKSRLVDLAGKVDALYNAVCADEAYGPLVIDRIPQGSWAHRTIIKPETDREYDADVLLKMDAEEEWADSKAKYLTQLGAALGRAGYAQREVRTRCVRVTYANDCHVDLVPYVNTGWDEYRIVNKRLGVWEASNPEGFTDWMRERDDWTNGHFRKVVRLMKYVRDHHGHFQGTRSIILTTLLGNQVSYFTKLVDPDAYGSVSKALVTLVEALDTWLQAQVDMPSVPDPSSGGTTFDHRWSETSFKHLRARIQVIAPEMRDALDETNADESARKWRIVFGDDFKKDSTESKSANPFTAALGGLGSVGASSSRPGRAG